MTSLLCLKKSLPQNFNLEAEALDLVLALASFDYDIQLIFYGDGVYSLLQKEAYAQRLQALPLFDIHDVWVDSVSLEKRGLSLAELSFAAKPLYVGDLNRLIQQSKGVYSL